MFIGVGKIIKESGIKMEKQTKKKAIKEAVEKCPYKKECGIKNIDDMNCIEIGKYLNTKNHTLPTIIKHHEGYDLHYGIGYLHEEYKFETFKSLNKAIERFKEICKNHDL